LLNGAAIAAQGLGHLDEALDCYRRALDIVPDLPDIYYNMGDLHRRSGHAGAAVDAYRRTVELRPDDAGAHFALGELLTRRGDWAEAIQAYRGFLSHWKGDPRYAEIAEGRIDTLKSHHRK
jgi:tetratricopeptide (TPR) repeat protein